MGSMNLLFIEKKNIECNQHQLPYGFAIAAAYKIFGLSQQQSMYIWSFEPSYLVILARNKFEILNLLPFQIVSSFTCSDL